MFQAGLAKFDVEAPRRSSSFRCRRSSTATPTQQSMVMPRQSHVDGKVWTNDVSSQVDPAARSRDRQVRDHRSVQVHAEGPQPFALRHGGGCRQQPVLHGLRRRERRAHRRQDRPRHDLPDPDAALAAAPHHDGRAGPRLVRRVRRQQGRRCSIPRGKASGSGTCRRRTPIRTTSSSTRTASCGAARCRTTGSCASIRAPATRSSTCCRDQTNVRRIFVDNTHHAGDVLGRQQSPRRHRQARAAGLARTARNHYQLPRRADTAA